MPDRVLILGGGFAGSVCLVVERRDLDAIAACAEIVGSDQRESVSRTGRHTLGVNRG